MSAAANPLPQQFIPEARDLLEQAGRSLLALEREADGVEPMNALFRAVHTLKGTSGLFEIGSLTRVVHAPRICSAQCSPGSLRWRPGRQTCCSTGSIRSALGSTRLLKQAVCRTRRTRRRRCGWNGCGRRWHQELHRRPSSLVPTSPWHPTACRPGSPP